MGDIKFSIDTGLVEALKRVLPLGVFVETGTFEGDAIEIARPYFEVVHSIELSPEYFELAKERFQGDAGIHLYLGDSGKMLTELRPHFAGKSVLFWLDAHWCVAQDTGGEKSQCPLLNEIRAVGQLNDDSAIMIDDARLFASPPPQPHEISQWPRLDEVIDALRAVGPHHELKIFNDVIVYAPKKAHQPLTDYMTRHTVTLLKIKDKADGYDVLDAQLNEKHAEITALKQAAVEKDTEIADLKEAANVKDKEIDSLKAETDTKDAEIDSLKSETNTKDVEIASLKSETNTKDVEIASLKEEANVKDGEIASLKRETDGKDGEIASLKQISNEREQLIFLLDGHVKTFQKIVADLNVAHGAKDAIIAQLNGDVARLQAEAAQLQSDLAGARSVLAGTQTELGRVAETLQKSEVLRAAREAEIAPQVARLQHLEWLYTQIPENPAHAPQEFEAKAVHIRNLDAVVKLKDDELARLRTALTESETSLANINAGLSQLELAKFYGRQLAEKEAVIQTLKRACDEREALIKQLAVDSTSAGAGLRKLWVGTRELWRLKVARPFGEWLFKKVVEDYWMQIGILKHYEPRPLVWENFPKPRLPVHALPKVGIVTPSYNQEAFIESTMLSVLNQNYPHLRYVVQDGASTDQSPAIVARYAEKLHQWESTRDAGQADAVGKGFAKITDLGATDLMAWLNSDDFISPRALRFVAEYFATHPDVDVVYGHRIIIDGHDQEIGRWVMPPHENTDIEWIDYVPQETLFWRKRAWDAAGGIDPSFQFALDWDLLLRFQAAGMKIVRLPYFLGCFRVHAHQKTSQHIHSIGSDEMTRLRNRIHPRGIDYEKISHYARKIRFSGALHSRLLALKIRR